MTEDLYLDVDVVKDASGELRANVDFSRYVGHVRAELLRKIDAAILDSMEPQLNSLGWVKECTCTMEKKQTGYFTGLICSKCGCTTFYRYAEPGEDGMVIGCPVPNYCPDCGARVVSEEEQGHMVADAIRRLEKAVER